MEKKINLHACWWTTKITSDPRPVEVGGVPRL